MEQEIIKTVRALREKLHELAEPSGEEKKTKAYLMDFLRQNTSLRLFDEGAWFCAFHEEAKSKETIAFRADMDALLLDGRASHLCGHDGHSAALAGLGLLLEKERLDRNIALIFQHAEETGADGKVCAEALEKYRADRVYAFHNVPGFPQSAVLLCRGTFACASRGMVLSFAGESAHAAYPEQGKNPGFAAARVILALPALSSPGGFRGLAMATLVGAAIGDTAFGAAAASARVCLTLRAWHDDDLTALAARIEKAARSEASRDGVAVSFSFCDIFPAAVNDGETLSKVEAVCQTAGLETIELSEPFRWSEDFGHYGAAAKSVMVGIGAGICHPPLHTKDYVFNDEILPAALSLFLNLAKFG